MYLLLQSEVKILIYPFLGIVFINNIIDFSMSN